MEMEGREVSEATSTDGRKVGFECCWSKTQELSFHLYFFLVFVPQDSLRLLLEIALLL